MTTQHDSDIQQMLDDLGERYRVEPDSGFERRVLDATSAGRTRRVPGRRRLLLVPGVAGGVAAAAAVVLTLVPPSTPSSGFAPTVETVSIAEMSFGLFDETFGFETSSATSTDVADVAELDPSSLDDWFDEGDSL